MSTNIKAIETEYNGYRFRSRLEARWAIFMDTLGIKYEYEKEGYDLDGIWYLPDFWLPEQQRWIEIKGQKATEEEKNKAKLLAIQTEKPVFLLAGNIGLDQEGFSEYKAIYFLPFIPAFTNNDDRTYYEKREQWGIDAEWTECSRCEKVGLNPFPVCIKWQDLPWLFCQCHNESYGGMKKPDHELSLWHNPSKDNNTQTDKILTAFQTARSTRFEHGETPIVKITTVPRLKTNYHEQSVSPPTIPPQHDWRTPTLAIEKVKGRWEHVKRRVKSKKDGNEIAILLSECTIVGVEGTLALPVIVIQTDIELSYYYLHNNTSYHATIEWAMKIELKQECKVRLLPPIKTLAQ